MKVAVIGGGAAGFFAAQSAKEHHPEATVCILEKTQKVLAKVKVSGGGRCNVTHDCTNNRLMSKNYPRGERFMRKALEQFNVQSTIDWFQSRGVELKIEDDGRMFPVSNDSQTIVDCLMQECAERGIQFRLGASVTRIDPMEGQIELKINDAIEVFNAVIVATGGSPKRAGLAWLEQLGHQIESPVPSLFTFNMPNHGITELMGLSVKEAIVSIRGTKIQTQGPLLITHWGMSGPAVLKASAIGARQLHDVDYRFEVQVNWAGIKEDKLRTTLIEEAVLTSNRNVGNKNPFDIPNRLWVYLLASVEVNPATPWNTLNKKALNKLINIIVNDVYQVSGKTTFKEEFVTAGGVSLESIDPKTMQSKNVKGLYFAGELLDIDGVTGGFNFQAAWTTGFIAGKLQ